MELGPSEQEFLEGLTGVPTVLLRTKSDLAPAVATGVTQVSEIVELSVVDGTGLGRLKTILPELVYGGLVRTGASVPALTRARQSEGVRKARDHVVAFVEALEEGTPVAVASALLRPAETALEELLGLISTDEILDRVFREFCIGK